MVGANGTMKKNKPAYQGPRKPKLKTARVPKLKPNRQRLLSCGRNTQERDDLIQDLKNEFQFREEIDSRAEELKEQLLSKNSSLPFNEIIYLNTGNPQALGQPAITFNREVLALCDLQSLLEQSETRSLFSADAIARSRQVLQSIPGGATGAYSHSQGLRFCREEIATGIENRDGYPSSAGDIFLTDGATPGVHMALQVISNSEKDGILVPIPAYPLYPTAIVVHGGSLVPYYLDEDLRWGLNISHLKKQLAKARSQGTRVQALVVINPGNPTGQVLEEQNQEQIVQFCRDENIILLADEVYQENIYCTSKEFHSFKKVSRRMGFTGEDFSLISFHSASKGFYGECGRRGGYMEVTGLPKEVKDQLSKLASVNLCSNISGQIMMSIIMNPPKPGDEAHELNWKEKNDIRESLARRAKKFSEAMSELQGVTCHEIEGAMYAFPRLAFPIGALMEADEARMPPDVFYARRLLEATGILVHPGSGYGQVPGTYHIKCTILPQEAQLDKVIEKFSKFHQEFMDQYRASPL
ncbi:unnamed protein product [Calypogeia fissa]